jgi:hypothetical protein
MQSAPLDHTIAQGGLRVCIGPPLSGERGAAYDSIAILALPDVSGSAKFPYRK